MRLLKLNQRQPLFDLKPFVPSSRFGNFLQQISVDCDHPVHSPAIDFIRVVTGNCNAIGGFPVVFEGHGKFEFISRPNFPVCHSIQREPFNSCRGVRHSPRRKVGLCLCRSNFGIFRVLRRSFSRSNTNSHCEEHNRGQNNSCQEGHSVGGFHSSRSVKHNSSDVKQNAAPQEEAYQ